jgi:D-arabinose 1-dehydrogenase-like Zn-dependent alcohol dehydrogenase
MPLLAELALPLFKLPRVRICSTRAICSLVHTYLAALGAKVIATAGTQDKLNVCKTFGGADEVLDYTKPGWQKEVLKLTGGKGVGKSTVRMSPAE